MNIVSLKVYGDDIDIDTIREALPSQPTREWRKGDEKNNGRAHLDSGFDVGIAIDTDPLALLEKIRVYLHECTSRGISFDMPAVMAELRILVALGDSAKPGPGIDFQLADLVMLTEMGICLSVSAYQPSASVSPIVERRKVEG